MSKKNIPRFKENNYFEEEYNSSYELEIKEKIFNKLENLKINEIIKLTLTQSIYNKYFYNIDLMNDESKIIDRVLN